MELQEFSNAFLQDPPIPDNCLLGIANAYDICTVDATKGQSKVFGDPLEKTNAAGVWSSPGVNLFFYSFVLCFDILADIALQLRAIGRFVVNGRADQRGCRC